MLTRFALSAAVAVSALTAMPAAAEAQSRYGYYGGSYDYAQYDRRYDRRYDARRYDARRYDRRYDARRHDRRYDNYYGRRCDSGTTGTILGAVVGGLLGREVAGRGDRTTGAIIGGAVGALGGRAIDRNCR